MRVALNGSFWDQPHTGSGQYLCHLWEALQARNAHTDRPIDLTLLRPGTQGESGQNNSQPAALGANRRPQLSKTPHSVLRIPHSDKVLWEQWGVAREARRARADLLHMPYLAAPLFSRVPTVVTAHDMIPWVVPGYAGSRSFRLYLTLALAGVRRARLIMADSEASRLDAIRILGISPSRVHTVYLGVETAPTYKPDELEEARRRY